MLIRIFVLWVMLAAPAIAGEIDGLSEEATKAYLNDYRLRTRYQNHGYSPSEIAQENKSRMTVIVYGNHENLDQRIRWIQNRPWPKKNKATFLRAIEWHKDAFNGGAEKLYRLSREYQNRPDAKENGYLFLSGMLLGRAAKAGHTKAMLEFKDHPEYTVHPAIVKNSRVYVYKKALENDQNAINNLIIAYLIDPIFDDDRIKGYYWLLRTRELPVSEKTRGWLLKSLSFLPESRRKQARGWISSGHIPPM